MRILIQDKDFSLWFPEASDKDGEYIHVRITKKPKYKEGKSAAMYLTEQKGRCLVNPERSYNLSDRETERAKERLEGIYDSIQEQWLKEYGKIVYK